MPTPVFYRFSTASEKSALVLGLVTLAWTVALGAAAAGMFMWYLSTGPDGGSPVVSYVAGGILAVIAVTALLHWRTGIVLSVSLTLFLPAADGYLYFVKKDPRAWPGPAIAGIGLLYAWAWFAKRRIINGMQRSD